MDRIEYVILYVADAGRSAAFYRDALGLPPGFVRDGYAEIRLENLKLGFLERARARELLGSEPSHGPAGEVLFLVDDVDAHAARLRDAGAEILSGPADRPWGHRTLHLADPDGHVVELAQEIPRTDR